MDSFEATQSRAGSSRRASSVETTSNRLETLGKAVERLATPAGRKIDLRNADAKGNLSTLTDNYFELTHFKAGDVVRLEVDTLGSALEDEQIQIWDGNTLAYEQDFLYQGSSFTVTLPKSSSGTLHLLVDAVSVNGPNDAFAVSGSSVLTVEKLGSIKAGGKVTSSTATNQNGEQRHYEFSASAGEVLEIQQRNPGNDTISYDLVRASSGKKVDEENSLPAYSRIDADEGYYFTESGGDFVLEVEPSFSSVSDLEVTINSMTPSSLGSGQRGDTISKTIGQTVEDGRSNFHTVRLEERVNIDGTVDFLDPNRSDNGVYFYDADYDHLFGVSGSMDDSVTFERGEDGFAPGLYVVRIEGDETLKKYRIDFKLTRPLKSEKEPNDTQSTAQPVSLGRGLIGESKTSDPDVYAFDLSSSMGANETLVAHVEGDSFESDQYTCRLKDGSGTVLDELTKRDKGCTALAGGLKKGRYYLETEIDVSSVIEYRVDVERRSGTLESEPNDNANKATSLQASSPDGARAYGSLNPSDTTDTFSFDVPSKLSGRFVRASIEELGPDEGADIEWTLLDDATHTIASSTGKSLSDGLEAGTYYLEVGATKSDLESSNGEDGEYRATLTLFEGVSTKPGKTIPDDDTSGVSSTLKLKKCSTLTGLKVAVSATHQEGGDLRIALTNPGGSTLLLQDAGFGFEPFGTKFYPIDASPDGGTLKSAFSGQKGTGPWTLKVSDREPDKGDGKSGGEGGTLDSWALVPTCK